MSLPVEAWQPERRPWVLDAHVAAAKQKVEVTTLEHERRRGQPQPTLMLHRAVTRVAPLVQQRLDVLQIVRCSHRHEERRKARQNGCQAARSRN